MVREALISSIDQLEKEIAQKQKELQQLRSQMDPEKIKNHRFLDENGEEISLLELFGPHSTLMVIHNMGQSCSYCTMWADGFSGIYPLLKEKTAFVLSSPDKPADQKAFAKDRGWLFPIISTSEESNTFTMDVGFKGEKLTYPGVSVFEKQADNTILHKNQRIFGPGDNFGVLWHLLDLLPEE